MALTLTFAVRGETLTAMPATTVMVAAEVLFVLVTEAAVSVTVAGEGKEGGAAYVTPVEVTLVSVPQVAPEQPPPASDHVTPFFAESFATVAVKF